MTRKVLLVVGLMMATVFSVANDVVTNPNSGTQVFLQTIFVCPVGYENPMPTTPHRPKAPMHAPEVYLEGHTLSFSYNNGYTLELVEISEDGDEVTAYTGLGSYLPLSAATTPSVSSMAIGLLWEKLNCK